MLAPDDTKRAIDHTGDIHIHVGEDAIARLHAAFYLHRSDETDVAGPRPDVVGDDQDLLHG